MLPESTIPAIFAGGEISRRSSTNPTLHITHAATITPTISVRAAITSENAGCTAATAAATTTPRIIAAPPAVDVGRV